MMSIIWIKTSFEGVHLYPHAINLPGVEFLANEHRHTFHVRVDIEVYHDDREIEFILFKRWIDSLFSSGVVQCNHQSCEMIARGIANSIFDKYGKQRYLEVSVSEDDENGATIVHKGE